MPGWRSNPKPYLALAMLVTLAPLGSLAQSTVLTGNQLFSTCNVDKETPLYAFCTGYVIGYVEGRNWGTFTAVNGLVGTENTAEANELGNRLVGHCIPEDADYQQLIDVAVSYMRRHPESRHESARSLIWLSFVEAFPCAE